MLFSTASALLLPLVAFGADPTKGAPAPQQVVEAIFAKASMPEIAVNPTTQGEVNALVDFAALSRSALGRQTKGLSSADIAWFQKTLQEIITKTVYPKAPDFLKGVSISYESTQLRGKVAVVKSSVQNKADLTDVHYRLAQQKDGSWRVVDVSIAGLSWVDSIGDQVRETIRQRKWAGLKAAMEKRLAELTKDSSGAGKVQ
jgi:ABC-type transporter MlaC component